MGSKGSDRLGLSQRRANKCDQIDYYPRGWKKTDDYPNTAEDVSYGYDEVGNLTSVSNSVATWTYTYNKLNLIETEQAVIDGKTFLLDPSYNTTGDLYTLTTPGQYIYYDPNVWGEPTRLGNAVTSVEYHPNGLVSSYTLGNGLTYSLLLDNRKRPWQQETKDVGTPVQRYVYGYSDANDLLSIDDTADNVDDLAATYDGLHRLSTATGTWGSYVYTYDTLNNVRSRTLNGSSNLVYGYNAANQLETITGSLSRSYSYTPRGHIWNDGSKIFSLNSLGQITGISGNLGTYSYDGNGKRIKTVKGAITEYTLYNRAGEMVYVENASAKSDFLLLNGKPVVQAVKAGATTTLRYLHTDLLGSVRKVTDQAKGVMYQEHFDPYGDKLNDIPAKVGYTGHAYDVETGYTYMQARFYDAAVGRFLSTDPVSFQETNPFTFNRYSYANNNPYSFSDPTGGSPVLAVGLAVGGYVAASGCAATPSCTKAVSDVAAKAVGALTGAINTASETLSDAMTNVVNASAAEDSTPANTDGPKSGYVDTKEGRSIPNRTTDVTKDDFEAGLKEAGYTGQPSKDGKTTQFEKPASSTTYGTRDTSKTGGPTADVKVDGETKVKIRLKGSS